VAGLATTALWIGGTGSTSRPAGALVEGELKRERAYEVLGDSFVVLSLASGAKAIDKIDLAPIANRHVACFPDNDKAGCEAMAAVARKLEAGQAARAGAVTDSVDVIRPDPAWPKSHDVADLIGEGWGAIQLHRYVEQHKVGVDAFEEDMRKRFPAEVQSAQDRLIAELATLDPISYAQRKKTVAKELGIPGRAIDQAVKALKPADKPSRDNLAPLPPTPWSEAVTARVVLDEVWDFLRRFIVVDEHALVAIVLWMAFTHCFEVAETSPRLAILSPTKRCGKSRLLELLAALCPSALSASNLTPSAVFRTIDAERCVLLIDEADTFVRGNEDLRGLLNSGHTRASAYVIRSVPNGDDWAPKKFSTWAPAAIAAIGRLPETWIDRSIVISMRRKRPAQKVERLTRRHAEARELASALASKFARMAADNLTTLRQAVPSSPEVLNDRAADNWETLFAIADLAGGDWPEAARAAAKALSGNDSDDSLSIRLLADIRDILADRSEDEGGAIGSSELTEKLCGIELAPWSTLARGKPLTAARLARMLKDFGIFAQRSAARRDYRIADFTDAISIYAPYPPDQSVIASQPIGRVGRNALFKASSNDTLKSEQTLTGRRSSDAMTLSNGGIALDHEISPIEEAETDPEERF